MTTLNNQSGKQTKSTSRPSRPRETHQPDECNYSKLSDNHPSGVVEPSQSDRMLTDALKQALRRERFLDGRPASYLFISKRGNRLDGGEVHLPFAAVPVRVATSA
jgi:hypothetical protein